MLPQETLRMRGQRTTHEKGPSLESLSQNSLNKKYRLLPLTNTYNFSIRSYKFH